MKLRSILIHNLGAHSLELIACNLKNFFSFKLQVPSSKRGGFTLIEIMIVMALFAVLLGFGLIVGMDFYRSYSFRSERNIALAVLRKARIEAMVNLDQAPHGVRIESNQYTLFEGSTFVSGASLNEVIKVQPTITILDPVTGNSILPTDIVFGQLSGTSTAVSFLISDGARQSKILINNEGQIDW